MADGYSPPRMAALPQGTIPELWFLTAASRIRQLTIHQVGLELAPPYSLPPFCRVLAHGATGTRTVPR